MTGLAVSDARSSRSIFAQTVEFSQQGSVELADRLTQLYTGKQRFYGDIYPLERQGQETRVVCRIQPNKVNVVAIFG